MAAINMQTPDIPFQMNAAFFEQNGRSGYVPKPNLMRKADAKFNPFEMRTMDLVVPAYLSLTVSNPLNKPFLKMLMLLDIFLAIHLR